MLAAIATMGLVAADSSLVGAFANRCHRFPIKFAETVNALTRANGQAIEELVELLCHGEVIASHSVGFRLVARDTADGVGIETGGWLRRTRHPGASLVLPEDETVFVQTNRSPIIRANQTHRVIDCDCETTTIAGLPEARTVPQLDRAITRKAAIFNAVANALSNEIWSHALSVAY